MLSSILLQILEVRKVNQKDLSAITDIDTTHLNRLITGERFPTYHQILQLSNALKLDPAVFFPEAKYLFSRTINCDTMLCRPKLVQKVYPLSFGVMYANVVDEEHNLAIMYFHITSEMYKFPFKQFMTIQTNPEKMGTRINYVVKGSVTYHYDFGEKIVREGDIYEIKGYEQTTSATVGTVINIIMSYRQYTYFIENIKNLQKIRVD